MKESLSVIFQAAKLGDIPQILAEFEWATQLTHQGIDVGRVYGLSGGVLAALAFALQRSAQIQPEVWGNAANALEDFSRFLRTARSRKIRSYNLDPRYGVYNLRPLRRWIANRLQVYCGQADLPLSRLPVQLYLCAIDQDGTLTLFGPLDERLRFQYHAVLVGPPRDASLLDALIASLSTMLSTEPTLVNGEWYRDSRPAIVDAGAMIADLEAQDPRPILRTRPFAPIRPWKVNWITSSFIMHSQNERNQTLLASYYLDLLERHRALITEINKSGFQISDGQKEVGSAIAGHIDLPYVGSTEAFTNMRQSVENKESLMAKFRDILKGQLDHFPFERLANVIYGAGGFSGILAGLVTTRAVDTGFERHGGKICQVYGVSAGVLNGFFHAIQLAAQHNPDLYRPVAKQALSDLEQFIAQVSPQRIAKFNRNPARFWIGWAHLGPLEEFLLERLAAYTGSQHPAQITFDDIALPLTVIAARRDGFSDFMGMSTTGRRMRFGGKEWQIRPAPVVRAIIAGWSMNTYIMPTPLDDQLYTDGGGTFYDPGLFVAMLDPKLTNLLNIHLDEPERHTYHLPPRPNLVKILFDTHNYVFPEERRRMRLLTDLLYEHFRLREHFADQMARNGQDRTNLTPLLADFRQEWDIS